MSLRGADGRGWALKTLERKRQAARNHSAKKAKPSPATTPGLICTVAKTMASPKGAHPFMSLSKPFRQLLSRDKRVMEELLVASLRNQKHLWGQLTEEPFQLAPD